MQRFVLISLAFLFFLKTPVYALEKQVQTSAVVGGGNTFVLFGYTSPHATVTISGESIAETTYARSDGYFEFQNIFSPFFSQETCIISIDTLGRLTSPSCLPPFPINYQANIGPVILSPSVSVNKGDFYIGETAILTGKTIPNTEVTLSFFKDEKESIFKDLIKAATQYLPFDIQKNINTLLSHNFTIVKDVEAFSFPELNVKSDTDGNFSISLPTANQSYLRTFVQTQYEKSPSQKSLTLNIKVLPYWVIIFQIFGFLFASIRAHIFPLILLSELVFVLIYIKEYLIHALFYKKRSIVPYKKTSIMIFHPLEITKVN
jgi:hypothetical protein